MTKKKYISIRFWQCCSLVLFLIILGMIGAYAYYSHKETERFQIVSELSGNIFPSAILSTASTGTQVIQPSIKNYVGNPQVEFGIRVKATSKNCRVHIELSETPYFARSVSDFVLPIKDMVYMIYPDVLWNYDALKNNSQPQPISFAVSLKVDGEKPIQKITTMSMRSINECLLCYKDENLKLHDTSLYFAAYVNEDHPMIDILLREALNTKIVRKFVGVQQGEKQVDKQVYALWNMLQKRHFTYSSISYSSLSSNMIYCQKVRTIDDALQSAQINCVDGTVLFASLLRAINIEPVMIRVPGHMFIGYYTDTKNEKLQFLETTIIGDVSLDEYFPDEKLDSISGTKTQSEMSRLTFDKAKEYATKKYEEIKENTGDESCQFLRISKSIRSKIQSIGR